MKCLHILRLKQAETIICENNVLNYIFSKLIQNLNKYRKLK